jgi:hypothetical protein
VNKTKAVLVLGYNNTRINDVRKIREKAKQHLNAITILCKKNPNQEDKGSVDHAIDVGLELSDENINKVSEELRNIAASPIALLPFSDPGTQLAGGLTKIFPLQGPDQNKIQAALNKRTFREFEQQATNIPNSYKRIKSIEIQSIEQLKSLHKELKGKIFLKPAKEGNSRGCINLMSVQDLEKSWDEINKYLSAGIVAEELILGGAEYSWDHVNGYSWVTEKRTTNDYYNTEYQHIVPAPLDKKAAQSISEAGEFMANIAGYKNGACHNEVFYFADSNKVCAVEPNLRPAGGRIWDLANLAFDNFDPWKEWILWSSGKVDSNKKKLNHTYFSGIRKIRALKNGILEHLPSYKISDFTYQDIELIDIIWTKKIGDLLSSITKDNSDYVGHIIARSKNYNLLNDSLEKICINLQKMLSIRE